MDVFILLLLILFATTTKSNKKTMDKFRKPFPQFRLTMEEDFSDKVRGSVSESSDNFVSFLVDNVKNLFVPPGDSVMLNKYGHEKFDSGLLLHSFKTSTDTMRSKMGLVNNSLTSDNFDLPFLQVDGENDNFKANISKETDRELLQILKTLELSMNKPENHRLMKSKRTCITCDNILNEDCSNPNFKLVPLKECQHEDDVCYSQHTPFGIIDRGCFNVNHDLTLFVCACNLCNYISISEMPYIFSNKREWIENVIELSRGRRFRESIFKDMSCLRCEVNVTAKRGNVIADASCLEGDILTLPRQICNADEICGVKAIRSQGYIWRGCVTEPLYNYWWRICDSDWCNYDSVVSVYDVKK